MRFAQQKIILKIISGFTLFFFISTSQGVAQIAFPVTGAPEMASVTLPLEKLDFPQEFVNVQEEFRSGSDKPLIIFLQDAHVIFDAQMSTQKFLDYLGQKYGVSLVALEGGSGRIDPTLFRAFPEENIKKKIFTDYVSDGELSGAEFAALLNPTEAEYYGIEDWDLYEKNYLAFLRAMKNKDAIFSGLSILKNDLDIQRRSIYSARLNDFHEKYRAFKEESIHLLEFLKYLKGTPGVEQKMTGMTHLKTLMDSVEIDASMDKEGLEIAIRRLADDFKRRHWKDFSKEQAMKFNGDYQDFVIGKMDAAKFLKSLIHYADEQGDKLPLSMPMRELLGHADTLSMIKGTKLFDELKQLVLKAEAELITGEGERELAEKYRSMDLLTELAKLEVDRDQLESYWKDNKQYLKLLRQPELLNPALEFYRLALARDESLHKNLMTLVGKKKAKAVVVILGGFHAKGFERKLKEEGCSYAVVTPQMGSLRGHEKYEEVMKGKLSYKEYLKTDFYDAFVKHSTMKLVAELDETEFRKTIKLWRDDLIRDLAEKGQTGNAGQYTRYLDLLVKLYIEKFGTQNLNSKSKEEILKDIREELTRSRKSFLDENWKKFETQLNFFSNGLKQLVQNKAVNVESVQKVFDASIQTKGTGLQIPMILIRQGPEQAAKLMEYMTGNLPLPEDVSQLFQDVDSLGLIQAASQRFLSAVDQKITDKDADFVNAGLTASLNFLDGNSTQNEDQLKKTSGTSVLQDEYIQAIQDAIKLQAKGPISQGDLNLLTMKVMAESAQKVATAPAVTGRDIVVAANENAPNALTVAKSDGASMGMEFNEQQFRKVSPAQIPRAIKMYLANLREKLDVDEKEVESGKITSKLTEVQIDKAVQYLQEIRNFLSKQTASGMDDIRQQIERYLSTFQALQVLDEARLARTPAQQLPGVIRKALDELLKKVSSDKEDDEAGGFIRPRADISREEIVKTLEFLSMIKGFFERNKSLQSVPGMMGLLNEINGYQFRFQLLKLILTAGDQGILAFDDADGSKLEPRADFDTIVDLLGTMRKPGKKAKDDNGVHIPGSFLLRRALNEYFTPKEDPRKESRAEAIALRKILADWLYDRIFNENEIVIAVQNKALEREASKRLTETITRINQRYPLIRLEVSGAEVKATIAEGADLSQSLQQFDAAVSELNSAKVAFEKEAEDKQKAKAWGPFVEGITGYGMGQQRKILSYLSFSSLVTTIESEKERILSEQQKQRDARLREMDAEAAQALELALQQIANLPINNPSILRYEGKKLSFTETGENRQNLLRLLEQANKILSDLQRDLNLKWAGENLSDSELKKMANYQEIVSLARQLLEKKTDFFAGRGELEPVSELGASEVFDHFYVDSINKAEIGGNTPKEKQAAMRDFFRTVAPPSFKKTVTNRNGKKIDFFFSKLFTRRDGDPDGRIGLIVYIKDTRVLNAYGEPNPAYNKYVPRTYYRSNSQVFFRYIPMSINGWIDKGDGEDSETAVAELQKEFHTLAVTGDFFDKTLSNEDRDVLFYGTTKKFGDVVEKLDARRKKGMAVAEGYHTLAQTVKDSWALSEQSDSARPNWREQSGKDPERPEDIGTVVPGDSPDFSKEAEGFEGGFRITSALRKDGEKELYLARAFLSKNGLYRYVFVQDSRGRAYIGSIEYLGDEKSDNGFSPVGVRNKWVKDPYLTTPLYEYSEQTTKFGKDYGDRSDRAGNYVGMWDFLKRIPMIQEFVTNEKYSLKVPDLSGENIPMAKAVDLPVAQPFFGQDEDIPMAQAVPEEEIPMAAFVSEQEVNVRVNLTNAEPKKFSFAENPIVISIGDNHYVLTQKEGRPVLLTVNDQLEAISEKILDSKYIHLGRADLISMVNSEGKTVRSGEIENIPVSAAGASRNHLFIELLDSGTARLRDLGSRNGTSVRALESNNIFQELPQRTLQGIKSLKLGGEKGEPGFSVQYTGNPLLLKIDDKILLLTKKSAAAEFTLIDLTSKQQVNLTGDHFVGRDPSADLVLPSEKVSKRHLGINVNGLQISFQGLFSTNGTTVMAASPEIVRIANNPLRYGEASQLGQALFNVAEVTDLNEVNAVGQRLKSGLDANGQRELDRALAQKKDELVNAQAASLGAEGEQAVRALFAGKTVDQRQRIINAALALIGKEASADALKAITERLNLLAAEEAQTTAKEPGREDIFMETLQSLVQTQKLVSSEARLTSAQMLSQLGPLIGKLNINQGKKVLERIKENTVLQKDMETVGLIGLQEAINSRVSRQLPFAIGRFLLLMGVLMTFLSGTGVVMGVTIPAIATILGVLFLIFMPIHEYSHYVVAKYFFNKKYGSTSTDESINTDRPWFSLIYRWAFGTIPHPAVAYEEARYTRLQKMAVTLAGPLADLTLGLIAMAILFIFAPTGFLGALVYAIYFSGIYLNSVKTLLELTSEHSDLRKFFAVLTGTGFSIEVLERSSQDLSKIITKELTAEKEGALKRRFDGAEIAAPVGLGTEQKTAASSLGTKEEAVAKVKDLASDVDKFSDLVSLIKAAANERKEWTEEMLKAFFETATAPIQGIEFAFQFPTDIFFALKQVADLAENKELAEAFKKTIDAKAAQFFNEDPAETKSLSDLVKGYREIVGLFNMTPTEAINEVLKQKINEVSVPRDLVDLRATFEGYNDQDGMPRNTELDSAMGKAVSDRADALIQEAFEKIEGEADQSKINDFEILYAQLREDFGAREAIEKFLLEKGAPLLDPFGNSLRETSFKGEVRKPSEEVVAYLQQVFGERGWTVNTGSVVRLGGGSFGDVYRVEVTNPLAGGGQKKIVDVAVKLLGGATGIATEKDAFVARGNLLGDLYALLASTQDKQNSELPGFKNVVNYYGAIRNSKGELVGIVLEYVKGKPAVDAVVESIDPAQGQKFMKELLDVLLAYYKRGFGLYDIVKNNFLVAQEEDGSSRFVVIDLGAFVTNYVHPMVNKEIRKAQRAKTDLDEAVVIGLRSLVYEILGAGGQAGAVQSLISSVKELSDLVEIRKKLSAVERFVTEKNIADLLSNGDEGRVDDIKYGLETGGESFVSLKEQLDKTVAVVQEKQGASSLGSEELPLGGSKESVKLEALPASEKGENQVRLSFDTPSGRVYMDFKEILKGQLKGYYTPLEEGTVRKSEDGSAFAEKFPDMIVYVGIKAGRLIGNEYVDDIVTANAIASNVPRPNVLRTVTSGKINISGEEYSFSVARGPEGQSFIEWYKSLSPAQRVRATEEVARLTQQHTEQVIRTNALWVVGRDVKPGNAMRTKDGKDVWILDSEESVIAQYEQKTFTRMVKDKPEPVEEQRSVVTILSPEYKKGEWVVRTPGYSLPDSVYGQIKTDIERLQGSNPENDRNYFNLYRLDQLNQLVRSFLLMNLQISPEEQLFASDGNLTFEVEKKIKDYYERIKILGNEKAFKAIESVRSIIALANYSEEEALLAFLARFKGSSYMNGQYSIIKKLFRGEFTNERDIQRAQDAFRGYLIKAVDRSFADLGKLQRDLSKALEGLDLKLAVMSDEEVLALGQPKAVASEGTVEQTGMPVVSEPGTVVQTALPAFVSPEAVAQPVAPAVAPVSIEQGTVVQTEMPALAVVEEKTPLQLIREMIKKGDARGLVEAIKNEKKDGQKSVLVEQLANVLRLSIGKDSDDIEKLIALKEIALPYSLPDSEFRDNPYSYLDGRDQTFTTLGEWFETFANEKITTAVKKLMSEKYDEAEASARSNNREGLKEFRSFYETFRTAFGEVTEARDLLEKNKNFIDGLENSASVISVITDTGTQVMPSRDVIADTGTEEYTGTGSSLGTAPFPLAELGVNKLESIEELYQGAQLRVTFSDSKWGSYPLIAKLVGKGGLGKVYIVESQTVIGPEGQEVEVGGIAIKIGNTPGRKLGESQADHIFTQRRLEEGKERPDITQVIDDEIIGTTMDQVLTEKQKRKNAELGLPADKRPFFISVGPVGVDLGEKLNNIKKQGNQAIVETTPLRFNLVREAVAINREIQDMDSVMRDQKPQNILVGKKASLIDTGEVAIGDRDEQGRLTIRNIEELVNNGRVYTQVYGIPNFFQVGMQYNIGRQQGYSFTDSREVKAGRDDLNYYNLLRLENLHELILTTLVSTAYLDITGIKDYDKIPDDVSKDLPDEERMEEMERRKAEVDTKFKEDIFNKIEAFIAKFDPATGERLREPLRKLFELSEAIREFDQELAKLSGIGAEAFRVRFNELVDQKTREFDDLLNELDLVLNGRPEDDTSFETDAVESVPDVARPDTISGAAGADMDFALANDAFSVASSAGAESPLEKFTGLNADKLKAMAADNQLRSEQDVEALTSLLLEKARANSKKQDADLAAKDEKIVELAGSNEDVIAGIFQPEFAAEVARLFGGTEVKGEFQFADNLIKERVDALVQNIRLVVIGEAAVNLGGAAVEALSSLTSEQLDYFEENVLSKLRSSFQSEKAKTKIDLAIAADELGKADDFVSETLIRYADNIGRLNVLFKKGQPLARGQFGNIVMTPWMISPNKVNDMIRKIDQSGSVAYLMTVLLGASNFDRPAIFTDMKQLQAQQRVKAMAFEWSLIALLKLATLSKAQLDEAKSNPQLLEKLIKGESSLSFGFTVNKDGSFSPKLSSFIQSLISAAQEAEKLAEAA